jgi:glycosyltransferase involved in cell wall biosynthesis
MRVAHVIPGLAATTGGPAIGTVETALALRHVGVATTIFTTDLPGPANGRTRRRVTPDEFAGGAASLDIRVLPVRSPRRLGFAPSLSRALKRELTEYALVHIHSLYLFPDFAAYRAALRAGVPYIVSSHGMLDPWIRQRGRARKALADWLWQRKMLERADVIVFGAMQEAQLAADVAPAVPRVAVPAPIDWQSFGSLPPSSDFRRRYLGGFEGRLVLFMGRLTPKKRVDLLIAAFAQVARTHENCMLAIAGPDEAHMRARLEVIAERERVRKHMAFVGMLRGEDKRAALGAADMWVLPSHSEGGSVAFMEALAAGVATIAPASVTIAADAVAAGASFQCDLTVQGLAHAMATLIDDNDRRTEIGRAARLYAKRFDRDVVAGDLARIYETVVHNSASTGRSKRGASE